MKQIGGEPQARRKRRRHERATPVKPCCGKYVEYVALLRNSHRFANGKMHREDKSADFITDRVLSGSEILNLSMYESKELVTELKNVQMSR